MARRDVTLDIGGDTRAAEKEISKLTKKTYRLNLDAGADKFSQPLGRITGQLGEFEKSLEASNARVLAFSASAGALYAVQKGLRAVFESAVDVEKRLADINVILNVSGASLNKFSDSLFNVAKNTASSFAQVADAATELSRQGLSVQETLKRTSDALILARLSGMQAAESVDALTAALNSFSRAAIDSTVFVSKLAAVDAAFAVSSADLAKAIQRVGSSAQEAGLDLDELIAAVTAAQQITARGGAVIGNSFKTIFTRIQRPRVLRQLEELGIATKDLAGNVKPAMGILKELASTYDILSSAQRAQISELIGGVFQVNVLKASLRDLGKEYSLYNSALKISNTATDEAKRRNEELNKTVSATLNKVVQNLTKVGAQMGELSFGPAIKRIGGLANAVLEAVDLKDAEGVGSRIAKGVFGGIGKFLSGPGLISGVALIYRVFSRLTSQVKDAFQTITGIGGASASNLEVQKKLAQIYEKSPKTLKAILRGEVSLKQAHDDILSVIRKENRELEQQSRLMSKLAGSGLRVRSGGALAGTVTTTKSSGHIPSFASKKDKVSAATELANASYAKPSTRAIKDRMPGEGVYFRNSQEKKVKAPGYKQPFVNPPLNSPEGKKHRAAAMRRTGMDPYMLERSGGASRGYIPNYAKVIDYDLLGKKKYDAIMKMALANQNISFRHVVGAAGVGKTTFAKKIAGGRMVREVDEVSNKGDNLVFISSGVTTHREGLFRGASKNYLLKAKASQIAKQKRHRAKTGIGLGNRQAVGGIDPAHNAPHGSILAEAVMGTKFRANSTLLENGVPVPWKDTRVYGKWLHRMRTSIAGMQGDENKDKRSRYYKRIGGKLTTQSDGFVPSFAAVRGRRALTKKDFVKVRSSTPTVSLQDLAAIRPSIAKNHLPFGAKRQGNNVRLGEAVDPYDKLSVKLSYFKTRQSYAQLRQRGYNNVNFETAVNSIYGYTDTGKLSSKYGVDGIKKGIKRLTAEQKFMDQGFMQSSGFDDDYFASKQYFHAVASGMIPPRPSRNQKREVGNLGSLRIFSTSNDGYIPTFARPARKRVGDKDYTAEEYFNSLQASGMSANDQLAAMQKAGFSKNSITNLGNRNPVAARMLSDAGYKTGRASRTESRAAAKAKRIELDALDIATMLIPDSGVSTLGSAKPKKNSKIKQYLQALNLPASTEDINKFKIKFPVRGPSVDNEILGDLRKEIVPAIADAASDYGSRITKIRPGRGAVEPHLNEGAIQAAAGTIFESGLKGGFGVSAGKTSERFDVNQKNQELKDVFNLSTILADFKIRDEKRLRQDMADKIISRVLLNPQAYPPGGLATQKPLAKAGPAGGFGFAYASQGFVPNYANPLEQAVGRERDAGVPVTSIRVGRDKSLVSKSNPGGLGVFNTRDEPLGLKQGINRSKRMGIDPKSHGSVIPNYAVLVGKGTGRIGSDHIAAVAGDLDYKTIDRLNKAIYSTYEAYRKGVPNAKKFAQESIEMGKDAGLTGDALQAYRLEIGKAIKGARSGAEGFDKPTKTGALTRMNQTLEKSADRLQMASFVSITAISTLEQFGDEGNKMLKSATKVTEGFSLAAGVMGTFPTSNLAKFGGLVGGLAVAADGLLKTFNDTGQVFQKEAEKSKERFTKLGNSLQQYASTFDELGKVMTDAKGTTSAIMKLRQRLEKLAADIPSEFRTEILGITDVTGLQTKIAEILEKQGSLQIQAQMKANLQTALDKEKGLFGTLNEAYLNFTGGQRQMFSGSSGETVFSRLIDDARKSLKFDDLGKDASDAAQRMRLLTMSQSKFMAALNGSYGATQGLTAVISQLSDVEFQKFRRELIASAKEAERMRRQFQAIETHRLTEASNLQIDVIQREIAVRSKLVEFEKKLIDTFAGGIQAFEDPEKLKNNVAKFQNAIQILGNVDPASPKAATAIGRGALQIGLSGLEAGIMPDIDIMTGRATGFYRGVIDQAAAGVEEFQRTYLENQLNEAQKQIAANRAAGKAPSQTLVDYVNKLQDVLAGDIPRQAAIAQVRKRLGLPEIDTAPIGLPPSGADRGVNTLGSLFGQRQMNQRQQNQFFEQIKRRLLGRGFTDQQIQDIRTRGGGDLFSSGTTLRELVEAFRVDDKGDVITDPNDPRFAQGQEVLAGALIAAGKQMTPAEMELDRTRQRLVGANERLKDSIDDLISQMKKRTAEEVSQDAAEQVQRFGQQQLNEIFSSREARAQMLNVREDDPLNPADINVLNQLEALIPGKGELTDFQSSQGSRHLAKLFEVLAKQNYIGRTSGTALADLEQAFFGKGGNMANLRELMAAAMPDANEEQQKQMIRLLDVLVHQGNTGNNAAINFINLLQDQVNPKTFIRDKRGGFIPSFSLDPLNAAISREAAALGGDTSKIRVTQNNKLKTGGNPMGFGVINTLDEANGKIPFHRFNSIKDAQNHMGGGMIAGKGNIPNFASKNPLLRLLEKLKPTPTPGKVPNVRTTPDKDYFDKLDIPVGPGFRGGVGGPARRAELLRLGIDPKTGRPFKQAITPQIQKQLEQLGLDPDERMIRIAKQWPNGEVSQINAKVSGFKDQKLGENYTVNWDDPDVQRFLKNKGMDDSQIKNINKYFDEDWQSKLQNQQNIIAQTLGSEKAIKITPESAAAELKRQQDILKVTGKKPQGIQAHQLSHVHAGNVPTLDIGGSNVNKTLRMPPSAKTPGVAPEVQGVDPYVKGGVEGVTPPTGPTTKPTTPATPPGMPPRPKHLAPLPKEADVPVRQAVKEELEKAERRARTAKRKKWAYGLAGLGVTGVAAWWAHDKFVVQPQEEKEKERQAGNDADGNATIRKGGLPFKNFPTDKDKKKRRGGLIPNFAGNRFSRLLSRIKPKPDPGKIDPFLLGRKYPEVYEGEYGRLLMPSGFQGQKLFKETDRYGGKTPELGDFERRYYEQSLSDPILRNALPFLSHGPTDKVTGVLQNLRGVHGMQFNTPTDISSVHQAPFAVNRRSLRDLAAKAMGRQLQVDPRLANREYHSKYWNQNYARLDTFDIFQPPNKDVPMSMEQTQGWLPHVVTHEFAHSMDAHKYYQRMKGQHEMWPRFNYPELTAPPALKAIGYSGTAHYSSDILMPAMARGSLPEGEKYFEWLLSPKNKNVFAQGQRAWMAGYHPNKKGHWPKTAGEMHENQMMEWYAENFFLHMAAPEFMNKPLNPKQSRKWLAATKFETGEPLQELDLDQLRDHWRAYRDQTGQFLNPRTMERRRGGFIPNFSGNRFSRLLNKIKPKPGGKSAGSSLSLEEIQKNYADMVEGDYGRLLLPGPTAPGVGLHNALGMYPGNPLGAATPIRGLSEFSASDREILEFMLSNPTFEQINKHLKKMPPRSVLGPTDKFSFALEEMGDNIGIFAPWQKGMENRTVKGYTGRQIPGYGAGYSAVNITHTQKFLQSMSGIEPWLFKKYHDPTFADLNLQFLNRRPTAFPYAPSQREQYRHILASQAYGTAQPVAGPQSLASIGAHEFGHMLNYASQMSIPSWEHMLHKSPLTGVVGGGSRSGARRSISESGSLTDQLHRNLMYGVPGYRQPGDPGTPAAAEFIRWVMNPKNENIFARSHRIHQANPAYEGTPNWEGVNLSEMHAEHMNYLFQMKAAQRLKKPGTADFVWEDYSNINMKKYAATAPTRDDIAPRYSWDDIEKHWKAYQRHSKKFVDPKTGLPELRSSAQMGKPPKSRLSEMTIPELQAHIRELEETAKSMGIDIGPVNKRKGGFVPNFAGNRFSRLLSRIKPKPKPSAPIVEGVYKKQDFTNPEQAREWLDSLLRPGTDFTKILGQGKGKTGIRLDNTGKVLTVPNKSALLKLPGSSMWHDYPEMAGKSFPPDKQQFNENALKYLRYHLLGEGEKMPMNLKYAQDDYLPSPLFARGLKMPEIVGTRNLYDAGGKYAMGGENLAEEFVKSHLFKDLGMDVLTPTYFNPKIGNIAQEVLPMVHWYDDPFLRQFNMGRLSSPLTQNLQEIWEANYKRAGGISAGGGLDMHGHNLFSRMTPGGHPNALGAQSDILRQEYDKIINELASETGGHPAMKLQRAKEKVDLALMGDGGGVGWMKGIEIRNRFLQKINAASLDTELFRLSPHFANKPEHYYDLMMRGNTMSGDLGSLQYLRQHGADPNVIKRLDRGHGAWDRNIQALMDEIASGGRNPSNPFAPALGSRPRQGLPIRPHRVGQLGWEKMIKTMRRTGKIDREAFEKLMNIRVPGGNSPWPSPESPRLASDVPSNDEIMEWLIQQQRDRTPTRQRGGFVPNFAGKGRAAVLGKLFDMFKPKPKVKEVDPFAFEGDHIRFERLRKKDLFLTRMKKLPDSPGEHRPRKDRKPFTPEERQYLELLSSHPVFKEVSKALFAEKNLPYITGPTDKFSTFVQRFPNIDSPEGVKYKPGGVFSGGRDRGNVMEGLFGEKLPHLGTGFVGIDEGFLLGKGGGFQPKYPGFGSELFGHGGFSPQQVSGLLGYTDKARIGMREFRLGGYKDDIEGRYIRDFFNEITDIANLYGHEGGHFLDALQMTKLQTEGAAPWMVKLAGPPPNYKGRYPQLTGAIGTSMPSPFPRMRKDYFASDLARNQLFSGKPSGVREYLSWIMNPANPNIFAYELRAHLGHALYSKGGKGRMSSGIEPFLEVSKPGYSGGRGKINETAAETIRMMLSMRSAQGRRVDPDDLYFAGQNYFYDMEGITTRRNWDWGSVQEEWEEFQRYSKHFIDPDTLEINTGRKRGGFIPNFDTGLMVNKPIPKSVKEQTGLSEEEIFGIQKEAYENLSEAQKEKLKKDWEKNPMLKNIWKSRVIADDLFEKAHPTKLRKNPQVEIYRKGKKIDTVDLRVAEWMEKNRKFLKGDKVSVSGESGQLHPDALKAFRSKADMFGWQKAYEQKLAARWKVNRNWPLNLVTSIKTGKTVVTPYGKDYVLKSGDVRTPHGLNFYPPSLVPKGEYAKTEKGKEQHRIYGSGGTFDGRVYELQEKRFKFRKSEWLRRREDPFDPLFQQPFPEQWMGEHKRKLVSEARAGTGKFDYDEQTDKLIPKGAIEQWGLDEALERGVMDSDLNPFVAITKRIDTTKEPSALIDTMAKTPTGAVEGVETAGMAAEVALLLPMLRRLGLKGLSWGAKTIGAKRKAVGLRSAGRRNSWLSQKLSGGRLGPQGAGFFTGAKELNPLAEALVRTQGRQADDLMLKSGFIKSMGLGLYKGGKHSDVKNLSLLRDFYYGTVLGFAGHSEAKSFWAERHSPETLATYADHDYKLIGFVDPEGREAGSFNEWFGDTALDPSIAAARDYGFDPRQSYVDPYSGRVFDTITGKAVDLDLAKGAVSANKAFQLGSTEQSRLITEPNLEVFSDDLPLSFAPFKGMSAKEARELQAKTRANVIKRGSSILMQKLQEKGLGVDKRQTKLFASPSLKHNPDIIKRLKKMDGKKRNEIFEEKRLEALMRINQDQMFGYYPDIKNLKYEDWLNQMVGENPDLLGKPGPQPGKFIPKSFEERKAIIADLKNIYEQWQKQGVTGYLKGRGKDLLSPVKSLEESMELQDISSILDNAGGRIWHDLKWNTALDTRFNLERSLMSRKNWKRIGAFEWKLKKGGNASNVDDWMIEPKGDGKMEGPGGRYQRGGLIPNFAKIGITESRTNRGDRRNLPPKNTLQDKLYNFIGKWEDPNLFNEKNLNKKLTSYKPTKNDVPTIGFGRTGADVKTGTTSTVKKEIENFKALLSANESKVRAYVGDKVYNTLSDNEKVSINSLYYNIGETQFRKSTALKKLKEGDKKGYLDWAGKFKYQKGKVLKGLENRRKAEKEKFLEKRAGGFIPNFADVDPNVKKLMEDYKKEHFVNTLIYGKPGHIEGQYGTMGTQRNNPIFDNRRGAWMEAPGFGIIPQGSKATGISHGFGHPHRLIRPEIIKEQGLNPKDWDMTGWGRQGSSSVDFLSVSEYLTNLGGKKDWLKFGKEGVGGVFGGGTAGGAYDWTTNTIKLMSKDELAALSKKKPALATWLAHPASRMDVLREELMHAAQALPMMRKYFGDSIDKYGRDKILKAAKEHFEARAKREGRSPDSPTGTPYLKMVKNWSDAAIIEYVDDFKDVPWEKLPKEVQGVWGNNPKMKKAFVSEVNKAAEFWQKRGATKVRRRGGTIPNFSNVPDPYALQDAINRESQAVPLSTIRVVQDNRLKTGGNPTGAAVVNTRDEKDLKVPFDRFESVAQAQKHIGGGQFAAKRGGMVPNYQQRPQQPRMSFDQALKILQSQGLTRNPNRPLHGKRPPIPPRLQPMPPGNYDNIQALLRNLIAGDPNALPALIRLGIARDPNKPLHGPALPGSRGGGGLGIKKPWGTFIPKKRGGLIPNYQQRPQQPPMSFDQALKILQSQGLIRNPNRPLHGPALPGSRDFPQGPIQRRGKQGAPYFYLPTGRKPSGPPIGTARANPARKPSGPPPIGTPRSNPDNGSVEVWDGRSWVPWKRPAGRRRRGGLIPNYQQRPQQPRMSFDQALKILQSQGLTRNPNRPLHGKRPPIPPRLQPMPEGNYDKQALWRNLIAGDPNALPALLRLGIGRDPNKPLHGPALPESRGGGGLGIKKPWGTFIPKKRGGLIPNYQSGPHRPTHTNLPQATELTSRNYRVPLDLRTIPALRKYLVTDPNTGKIRFANPAAGQKWSEMWMHMKNKLDTGVVHDDYLKKFQEKYPKMGTPDSEMLASFAIYEFLGTPQGKKLWGEYFDKAAKGELSNIDIRSDQWRQMDQKYFPDLWAPYRKRKGGTIPNFNQPRQPWNLGGGQGLWNLNLNPFLNLQNQGNLTILGRKYPQLGGTMNANRGSRIQSQLTQQAQMHHMMMMGGGMRPMGGGMGVPQGFGVPNLGMFANMMYGGMSGSLLDDLSNRGRLGINPMMMMGNQSNWDGRSWAPWIQQQWMLQKMRFGVNQGAGGGFPFGAMGMGFGFNQGGGGSPFNALRTGSGFNQSGGGFGAGSIIRSGMTLLPNKQKRTYMGQPIVGRFATRSWWGDPLAAMKAWGMSGRFPDAAGHNQGYIDHYGWNLTLPPGITLDDFLLVPDDQGGMLFSYGVGHTPVPPWQVDPSLVSEKSPGTQFRRGGTIPNFNQPRQPWNLGGGQGLWNLNLNPFLNLQNQGNLTILGRKYPQLGGTMNANRGSLIQSQLTQQAQMHHMMMMGGWSPRGMSSMMPSMTYSNWLSSPMSLMPGMTKRMGYSISPFNDMYAMQQEIWRNIHKQYYGMYGTTIGPQNNPYMRESMPRLGSFMQGMPMFGNEFFSYHKRGGLIPNFGNLELDKDGFVQGVGKGDTRKGQLPAGAYVLNGKAAQYTARTGGLVPNYAKMHKMQNVALEPGERVFMPGDSRIPMAQKLNSAIGRFSSGATTQYAQTGGFIGNGFIPNYANGTNGQQNAENARVIEALQNTINNLTSQMDAQTAQFEEALTQQGESLRNFGEQMTAWNPTVQVAGEQTVNVQLSDDLKMQQNNQAQDIAGVMKQVGYRPPPKNI